MFRTSISSGPPAKVKLSENSLVPDASPMKVRIRNSFQAQLSFLSRFVDRLVTAYMAYFNPSSPWACAPLLVPKNCPDEFCFTIDLQLVD